MSRVKEIGRLFGKRIINSVTETSDAETALMAVAELAAKTGVALESIPETVAERIEGRRTIDSRIKEV